MVREQTLEIVERQNITLTHYLSTAHSSPKERAPPIRDRRGGTPTLMFFCAF
jgi:hypothetical protein